MATTTTDERCDNCGADDRNLVELRSGQVVCLECKGEIQEHREHREMNMCRAEALAAAVSMAVTGGR
jgi:hypothetical protein